jgi:hypothetical protein
MFESQSRPPHLTNSPTESCRPSLATHCAELKEPEDYYDLGFLP